MKTTFGNDPCLKEGLIKTLKSHEKAKRFVHGSYFSSGQAGGCALGCTLLPMNPTVGDINRYTNEMNLFSYSGDVAAMVSKRYTLPIWLARLEEAIFEALPRGTHDVEWARKMIEATPVGIPFKELELRVRQELYLALKKLKKTNPGFIVADDGTGYSKGESITAISQGYCWPAEFTSGEEDVEGDRTFAIWMRDTVLELLKGVKVTMPEPVCEIAVKEERLVYV